MNYYVEVVTIESGQPRPYADHDFISELKFTRTDGRHPDWLEERGLPLIIPHFIEREAALMIARVYVPYKDKNDPEAHWASRYLTSFDRLEPSPPVTPGLQLQENRSDRWRIHVSSYFTD